MTSNTAVIDDDIKIEDHDMHPPLPEPEEEPAQPEYLEQGQRNHMIPHRFQDYLPVACIAPLQRIKTEPNLFGLYRQYKTLPSFDPDDATTIANLCDAPTFAIPPDTLQQRSPLSVYSVHSLESNAANLSTNTEALDSGPWFALFMNPTICRLMHWFYSTTTKMLNDLNRLVQEVILAPDFSSSDLQNFDAN
ncbi:uncharacterized protein EV420DRAFT_1473561 [Desarmillaria tabescens]|uniref:Uncharacterized protein n=1 Tax=Armillaria tabescens TaxID=1929756 RepID=A0AA39NLA7_ARMTA|nr:uncharacterized protein EV420DRAFT_1473561 [Desarmillaria tabescens]KAK0467706.1 hypothetical protein EV420DRAFT_1473561 [Desarmillaria tabescens]